jgi:hypothetical protein
MGGVKTISEIGNYADLCSFATKCRRTETRYDILWDYCVLLCLRDETIIELTPWSFVEFNSYNRLAKELAQRVGSFYTKGKRDNELFTIFNDKKNCYVFKYYE